MKKSVYIIFSFLLAFSLLCGCTTQVPAGSEEGTTEVQADPNPPAQTAAAAADPGTTSAETVEASEPEVTADPNADEKYQSQVYAMDTIMSLTAYGSQAEEALDAAEERIYELEADLDPENETGSIYAINAGAGLPVKVSEDALNVLRTALYYYNDTDGALDPGLYPIINAWGFITEDYRVPSREELAPLLENMHTGDIVIDEAAGTVTIPAEMQISLGAVAKGYTAQCVVDLMADYGVSCAILSLGGNVQTLGEQKPDGSQWQVAIMNPDDTGDYVGILHLGQEAVVTSGGYQRYFVQDGITYIHIIDPETGIPVDNDLLSVTVVTKDGTSADALSTSIFVMGAEKALEYYAENDDFELVLITTDHEVIITPGLTDCFTENGTGYTYTYLE